MLKQLITILFILFLIPAVAQIDSSTLLLKLDLKQAVSNTHTFQLPLGLLKKAERIEIQCRNCDNDETYQIIEHTVIVRGKDAPTFASNDGPEFTDGIKKLIKEMDLDSFILLDRIKLRPASSSETIELKPISLMPK
jgi:hypothetical protein